MITMDKIRVGSDFSGVGAFDQALRRLGIEYETEFSCDMDRFVRECYIHNYGEPKYYPDNVYNRDIPDQSLEIYMTSPPCQAFSRAGYRKGMTEERGILFFNSLEFIHQNKPRYFIFENVRGLVDHEEGQTMAKWIHYLGGKSINGTPNMFPIDGSVPYHLYYSILNSKDYGVPQNRERVFFVGIRDDLDNSFQFPPKEKLTIRLRDVLEKDVPGSYFLSEKMLEKIQFYEIGNDIIGHLNKGGQKGLLFHIDKTEAMHTITASDYKQPKSIMTASLEKIGYVNKDFQSSRIWSSNGISQTITSGTHGYGMGYILDLGIRRLTPRECFRLMDFPDSFDFSVVSNTQAYKQAGNSIVVNVLAKIISRLKLD